jgi:hypothetical protein
MGKSCGEHRAKGMESAKNQREASGLVDGSEVKKKRTSRDEQESTPVGCYWQRKIDHETQGNFSTCGQR